MSMFKKAEKKKIKLKLALTGTSGSGKTFSALRLAYGLGKKIALIDSENKRASLYSKQFDFDVLNLEKPHSPERYLEAINNAISEGYEVVIIDSMTHEWEYILDEKEKVDALGGNSFSNWKAFKARHNRFIKSILEADIHVIATYRSKIQFVVEMNDKGKQAPRKVGLGIQGQDNDEYEYTCVLDISRNSHMASASKDNTGIFNNEVFLIAEEHGVKLKEWLDDGVDVCADLLKIIEEKLISCPNDYVEEVGNYLDKDRNDKRENILRAIIVRTDKKIEELNNEITNEELSNEGEK